MMTCNSVRELIALEPLSDDSGLLDHLAQCAACSAYRRRHQSLDVVLRSEMRWEAPAALTAQLLALTAPAVLVDASLPRPRPSRWYVTLVYVLTMAVIGLSVAVAWQFLMATMAQIGLADALIELSALPGRGLQELVQTLPESRYAIDLFLRARDQLVWLLLVAVLWAALDRWNPQFGVGRRQVSS